MFRIGFGYDAHQFAQKRPLILGGVEIDYPLGLLGHSDADVLTHSVMDAILGALNLGSIGDFFPDTDPQYKDISSITLLDHVVESMKEKNYEIQNLDSVIVAQEPKLAPYISAIKSKLASHLLTSTDTISVKATTTEKMGFVGRKEGLSAYVTLLLKQRG